MPLVCQKMHSIYLSFYLSIYLSIFPICKRRTPTGQWLQLPALQDEESRRPSLCHCPKIFRAWSFSKLGRSWAITSLKLLLTLVLWAACCVFLIRGFDGRGSSAASGKSRWISRSYEHSNLLLCVSVLHKWMHSLERLDNLRWLTVLAKWGRWIHARRLRDSCIRIGSHKVSDKLSSTRCLRQETEHLRFTRDY